MKTFDYKRAGTPRLSLLAVAVTLAIAGCAIEPQSPEGASGTRAKLTLLQSNSALAARAPVEIREAEEAVRLAETPVGKELALGQHRVYMADQRVEIASARATARYAESERAALVLQRDRARLDARTSEADRARRESEAAQSAARTTLASSAAAAAEAERNAELAASNAEELQRQIDALKAEATDRGLVLTLGDVLFATGRSELNAGGNRSLDKLVTFLSEHPERSAAIEGHTDDVGSLSMNQDLSLHRAESVKSYLVGKGIQSARLSASGMGETRPVADNTSASGRQQNRRVEVIITNPLPAVAGTATPTN